MTTVAYSTLLPEVLPLCPGLPQPIAINAIRNSAIDFCRETMIWQEDIDVVNEAAANFPIPFPGDTDRIVRVLYVRSGDRVLFPTSDANLNRWYRGREWRADEGDTPTSFYHPLPETLQFYPKPSAGSYVSFTYRVAKEPLRDSTATNSLIISDHAEDVAAGALARLMMMPSVEWSNPQLAQYYGEVFGAAKNAALLSSRTGDNDSNLMVAFPRA